MPETLAYRVDQLTVNYGKTPVLWDINIEVPQGSIAGIIGPNGAGKSTLIKTSMQFIKPISGHITFFEKPLKEVRDKIAYVPQKGTVDWNFPINVREIVLMGRYHKRGFFSRINKEDEDIHITTRRSMCWQNTNKMLWKNQHAMGLKTGWTRNAGPCLCSVMLTPPWVLL